MDLATLLQIAAAIGIVASITLQLNRGKEAKEAAEENRVAIAKAEATAASANSVTHTSLHALKNQLQESGLIMERRVTIVEQMAAAAHKRLDAASPSIDWGRLLPMFEKMLDMEARKHEDLKEILQTLAERE